MPMEMSSLPPALPGLQLVRDPSTGQYLFIPATTTIGNYLKAFLHYSLTISLTLIIMCLISAFTHTRIILFIIILITYG